MRKWQMYTKEKKIYKSWLNFKIIVERIYVVV